MNMKDQYLDDLQIDGDLSLFIDFVRNNYM